MSDGVEMVGGEVEATDRVVEGLAREVSSYSKGETNKNPLPHTLTKNPLVSHTNISPKLFLWRKTYQCFYKIKNRHIL